MRPRYQSYLSMKRFVVRDKAVFATTDRGTTIVHKIVGKIQGALPEMLFKKTRDMRCQCVELVSGEKGWRGG